MADQGTRDRATELLRLHRDPALLTVVNVWDVVSAKVVAGTEGTKALATASHSIAAARGYPDGENIPVDEMLAAVERIVDSTDLPVTADLEGGYGDAAETVRRAIGIGVVGANIEDQMKPVTEAAAQVEAIMKVAEQEGVDFVLNARTDAFSLNRKGDPAENLAASWSAAGRSSTPAPLSCSCRRCSTRSRCPRWSRRSARNGSPRSRSPAPHRWHGSRSSAWPGSRSARSPSTWRSPRSKSWWSAPSRARESPGRCVCWSNSGLAPDRPAALEAPACITPRSSARIADADADAGPGALLALLALLVLLDRASHETLQRTRAAVERALEPGDL